MISRDYLEGLDLDKYNPKFDGYSEENALALPSNVIENSVRLYNAARVALERMVESNAVLTAKYSGLYGLLGGSMLETNEEGKRRVKTISEAKTAASPEGIAATYNDELVKLKQSAWNYLLTGLDFQKSLTVKAKKEFDSQFQKVSKLEFTESNIHGFLAGVAFNRGDMLNDVMLEIFDKFTGIYVDNRQFYKSYKSNEKHRTCAWRLKHTRVVLQINLTSSYSNTLDYQAREKLHDIDKAFAILDGKRVEDINGLSKSLEGVIVYGERLDSDYFEYRAFMNGNIHLFPKRKDLIDRLNRTVGKLRQWLPDEDEQVTAEFWKNYESEKTTKDLDKARKSMRRRTYSNYYDEDIEAAIDESLAKQKIDSGKFLNLISE